MVFTTYKEKLHRLSQRLVEAQKPLRILDAVKWDESIEAFLKKTKFKELPTFTPEDYDRLSPIPFDPEAKKTELKELAADIERDLGHGDPLGKILNAITTEYISVVDLLLARGKPEFGGLSRTLYGSPRDLFLDDENTIESLGQMLYSILSGIDDDDLGAHHPENLDASDVVKILNERFEDYFGPDTVSAKLSDGIVADAAAGAEGVKIKQGAKFSARDVDILEVHEGWVHVGTTMNGKQQRVAKWLSKGSPRVASTQEGLAVILEIFTFRSTPHRARAINDRILGISKAEQGANVLEIIEFYRTEGYSESEALLNAQRVFRGGVLAGGAPFTKDIAYCKGFIENYNFLRAAVRAGKPQLIPYLFAGKLHVDDVPLLYQKHKEGIVDPPHFLPPQFKDLHGLAVWMGFSSFLNRLDLKRIQEHYNKLFDAHT